MTFAAHVTELIDQVREPLGLDRWQLSSAVAELIDARACCQAQPEYREATILVDTERLKTGDDLAELVVHELTHCHTWPIHAIAEHLANALAESAPESHRESLRKLLQEQVRVAAEQTTTDVGHTYLRLLRRAGILDTPPVVS